MGQRSSIKRIQPINCTHKPSQPPTTENVKVLEKEQQQYEIEGASEDANCPGASGPVNTDENASHVEVAPDGRTDVSTDLHPLPMEAAGASSLAYVGSGFLVFTTLALPTSGFIFLFSFVGIGDYVFLQLCEHSQYSWYLLLLGAALVVMMLVLDADYWKGPLCLLRLPLCVAALGLIFVGISLKSGQYPYAAHMVSLLSLPFLALAVRRLLLRRVSTAAVLEAVALSLFVIIGCCALLSVLWMFALPPRADRLADGWDGAWINAWGKEVRVFWRGQVGCSRAAPGAETERCQLTALLWWAFPLWIGAPLAAFSLLCYYLGRVLGGNVSSGAGMVKVIRLFVTLAVFFVCSLYVTAAVAGAGLGATRAIEVGLFLFLVVLSSTVAYTLGVSALMRTMRKSSVYAKLLGLSAFWHDMAKAFLVFILWAPFLCYLPVSALNQLCRRVLPFTRSAEGGGVFTQRVQRLLRRLATWHWGSVLSKVTVWCILYLSLNVLVMQVTVVFFAWVNELLRAWPPVAVCASFFAIGVLMFTIPVVPGVPVYITAGVLIPTSLMNAAGVNDKDSEDVPAEFWVGFALACAVVFGVKMTAVYIEQERRARAHSSRTLHALQRYDSDMRAGGILIPWRKRFFQYAFSCQPAGELIGRYLGSYVSVRSIVNINSTEMRATRMMLSEPGLSWAKCTILVGGPDWPTSVLTGILKLSPVQMLIGTIPILALVVPSTAAGSFQLLKDKAAVYESVAALVTMVAMGLQIAALVGAVYVIDRAATQHKAALDAMEPDVEVLELDRKNAAMLVAWRVATHWDRPQVGVAPKALVLTAAAMLSVACYIATLLPCFDPQFGVASSIERDLDGNVLNVVLAPNGWIVVGFFACGWVLRIIYQHWAQQEAKRYLQEQRSSEPVAVADGQIRQVSVVSKSETTQSNCSTPGLM